MERGERTGAESPAARVIRICGGTKRTAELIGRHRSVVVRWRRPRSVGGTDGIVPARHQHELLRLARAGVIDLRPEDFVDMRPEAATAA